MRATQTNLSRAPRRSTLPKLAATIRPAKEAAARLKRSVGRFAIYDFLEAIYRVYVDLQASHDSKAVGPCARRPAQHHSAQGRESHPLTCH